MQSSNKRMHKMNDNDAQKRAKKKCSYGEKCYRLNPAHFREFSHSHLEEILNAHDGTDNYHIPEKYGLLKSTITDQLNIIIEKELYQPKHKRKDTEILSKDISDQGSSQSQIRNDNSNSQIQELSSESQIINSSNSSRQETSYQSQTINDSSDCHGQEMSSHSQIKNDSWKRLSKNESTDISKNKVNNLSKDSLDIDKIKDKRGDNNSPSHSSLGGTVRDSDYRPIIPPTRRAEDYLKLVTPRGKMAAKHAASAPYHMFYTTITDSKETHTQPFSITFLDILDRSLGELKCSLQINFMVDISWLLAQYYFSGYSAKKLTILYGEDSPDLKDISKKKPNVEAHLVNMATPFGKHHTKMMILCYEDGSTRVVVSTANLYIDDWENRTQGLWFSPRCPELPAGAMPHDGESPTMFKRSLLRYLAHYHLPQLTFYAERVKRCDFSQINVFLIASAPGAHFDTDWGMSRVGALLRQHCCVPANDNGRWPLLAQASSLGSFGKEAKLWLTGDFLHHFSKIKNQSQMLSSPPELKLIYPSLENVKQSHDGLLGGGCLPYAGLAHSKQLWLNQFLYQWRATSTYRNKAMPHIKSYTRISPDNKMAAYFLLTSGNVSKAAWGTINKGNKALRIMSYEAGVLFLPRFVINEDLFPLQGDTKNRLLLPYDIPPTKYTSDMSPWVSDYLYK